jgi:thiol-disulfide isomerase/thioredoxin
MIALRLVVPMRLLFACALATACNSAEAVRPRLELVDAPAVQDAATLIAKELVNAEHAHKRLLVYVGASWCEPCRRFHEAAASGKLDDKFGQLRLLVFDADRDTDVLNKADYSWRLIPLFAVPLSDGRSSGRQIEGSIKGDGAVDQIAPRLQSLLQ